ncbi:hypothetical protein BKA83DRAFT_4133241 [Pisolithus microcarpus]|nr:hypothetical protein BKA83DRAFT_4133241 [Pisolithus microcarpus]
MLLLSLLMPPLLCLMLPVVDLLCNQHAGECSEEVLEEVQKSDSPKLAVDMGEGRASSLEGMDATYNNRSRNGMDRNMWLMMGWRRTKDTLIMFSLASSVMGTLW